MRPLEPFPALPPIPAHLAAKFLSLLIQIKKLPPEYADRIAKLLQKQPGEQP